MFDFNEEYIHGSIDNLLLRISELEASSASHTEHKHIGLKLKGDQNFDEIRELYEEIAELRENCKMCKDCNLYPFRDSDGEKDLSWQEIDKKLEENHKKANSKPPEPKDFEIRGCLKCDAYDPNEFASGCEDMYNAIKPRCETTNEPLTHFGEPCKICTDHWYKEVEPREDKGYKYMVDEYEKRLRNQISDFIKYDIDPFLEFYKISPESIEYEYWDRRKKKLEKKLK